MSALPQSKSSKLKVPPLRSSGGYAYCFAGRRQVRLGRADDPETAGRYRTFVAEWVATGCRWPDEKRPEAVLTVQGIVDAYKNIGDIQVPIIVRLQGTNAKEAKELIDNSGLKVLGAVALQEAADRVKEVLK